DHLATSGIAAATAAHDTQVLFGWLMEVLSYQGISDRIASGFMEKHGAPDAAPIAAALASGPSCPKLRSYWHFERCGFHKGSRTCAEPDHMDGCGVPTLRLRNGRLNQTAFSLFLFMRDVAGGDLVGWIDRRLVAGDVAISQSDAAD